MAAFMSAASNAMGTGAGAKINWDNFNYPPGVRILHFDLAELDPAPRKVSAWIHRTYIMMMVALFLNLLFNIVIGAAGVKDPNSEGKKAGMGINILYSFFNLCIGVIIGMFTFHTGYKGVATNNSSMMFKYMALQTLLIIAMLIFSLIGVANYNGWTRLGQVKIAGNFAGFWSAAVVIESILLSIGWIMGGYALYLVWVFDKHGPMSITGVARAAATQGRV